MTSKQSASTLLRWRVIVSSFLLVAAFTALGGAIGTPRGIAQRAVYVPGRADALGPTPTPRPCNGALVTLLDENFDSLVPPALPPGWLATNALGPPPVWVTSDSGVPVPPADSPPNAAFIDDPGVVSDKRLDSPSIIPSEFQLWKQLTFRHNYNLDADVDPTVGFDGGVLEISQDGGNTFQDILAVGGTFVVGGYNRTITSDRGSPIAGRQAWSGNSGGFVTTTVNLPFNNPEILRWRMASDTSGSNEGWRVDNIVVIECNGTLPGTPRPFRTPRHRPTPAPRPTP
jgi:hypothetical protein